MRRPPLAAYPVIILLGGIMLLLSCIFEFPCTRVKGKLLPIRRQRPSRRRSLAEEYRWAWGRR